MIKPTGSTMGYAILLLCGVAAIPSDAQVTFTVLAQFDGTNGAYPWTGPLVQGADGNFYGTTEYSGAHLGGTVFKITPGGTLTTLHSFSGPDGNYSVGLVQGIDLNLYGVTYGGGSNCDCGTIFKITPDATFTLLHSFTYVEGHNPLSGLIQGGDGSFYGTIPFDGDPDVEGEIYKVTPDGTLTVVYGFSAMPGAAKLPYAPLVQGGDGNFYGTTIYGGTLNNLCGPNGCGIVRTPGWINAAIVGDVNGDGISDVVVTLANNDINVFLGAGGGELTFPGIRSPMIPGMNALALADFNGDGKLDVMTCGSSGTPPHHNNWAVALGNGDGTFQAPKVFPGMVHAGCLSGVVADFNGDGKADVAVSGWEGAKLSVFSVKAMGRSAARRNMPRHSPGSSSSSI